MGDFHFYQSHFLERYLFLLLKYGFWVLYTGLHTHTHTHTHTHSDGGTIKVLHWKWSFDTNMSIISKLLKVIRVKYSGESDVLCDLMRFLWLLRSHHSRIFLLLVKLELILNQTKDSFHCGRICWFFSPLIHQVCEVSTVFFHQPSETQCSMSA